MTKRIFDHVHIGLWLSVLAVIAATAVIVTEQVKDVYGNPLEHLETEVRQSPALATFYKAPEDDYYKPAAIALINTVTSVMGASVAFEDLSDQGIVGWTDPHAGAPILHIETTLRWTARLEVIAHEAAHRLAPPVFDPRSSESEVFAEAVSYLVCRRFEHDDLLTAARYLGVHKGGLHVLTDYRMEIEYAALVLTGGAR